MGKDLKVYSLARMEILRGHDAGEIGDGWVYVVEIDHNLYKIGQTQNLFRRLAELERDYRINSVIAANVDHHTKLEAALHRRFAATRHGGETFTLTKHDLDFIKLNFSGIIDLTFVELDW